MSDSSLRSPGWTAERPLRVDGESHHRIAYGVELVTRRRRPVFEAAAVRDRVEAAVRSAASGMGCRVLRCEAAPSTFVVHVEALPTVSPREVVEGLRERVEAAVSPEVGGVVFARRHVVTTAGAA